MRAATKSKFEKFVRDLQDEITKEMQKRDESLKIIEDVWSRKDHAGKDGGGGITRAFQGKLFENAGVNTSCVFGEIDPRFASSLNGSGTTLWATGISLIIHPRNPRVPTVHANFRMIEQGDKIWFGGGADLTPFYPHTEDFKSFHQTWKKACEPFGTYDQMKKTCDEYFVNHHRDGEMRGVGGIFFDHFHSGDFDSDYDQVTSLAKHFIESYFPIVDLRMNESYTDEDEKFQLYRRGRYVEFNLLHDRGTHFGLKSNGRVDSILISLPGRVIFEYGYKPREGSPHAEMNHYYFPRNWA